MVATLLTVIYQRPVGKENLSREGKIYRLSPCMEDLNLTAQAATLTQDQGLIEQGGIEQVPESKRTETRVWHLGATWFSANWVVPTVVVGALTLFFNLNLASAFIAIVLFNLLGALPVGYFSTFGPLTGLRQMVMTRFSFGWDGASFMAILNMAACLGWSVVNVVIGASLLQSGAGWDFNISVLLLTLLTCAVSVFGYKYVHNYERYVIVPTTIFFLALVYYAAPHLNVGNSFGSFTWAGFLLMGGAVYGFATGWSSYAADYTVKYSPSVGGFRIFRSAYLGVVLACILLETLGALLVTSVADWGNAFGSTGVGGLLAAVLAPAGGLGSLLLVLLGLTVVANNIPNDYSFGLSTQVVSERLHKFPRYGWTLIGAIIYALIAISLGPSIGPTFESYLLIIAYWLGPWVAIVVWEDLIRRHSYADRNYQNASKLPKSWPAVVSFLIGMVGVLLGASQQLYTGPVASWLGGADVGFELGFVFALVAYVILSRRTAIAEPWRYT